MYFCFLQLTEGLVFSIEALQWCTLWAAHQCSASLASALLGEILRIFDLSRLNCIEIGPDWKTLETVVFTNDHNHMRLKCQSYQHIVWQAPPTLEQRLSELCSGCSSWHLRGRKSVAFGFGNEKNESGIQALFVTSQLSWWKATHVSADRVLVQRIWMESHRTQLLVALCLYSRL